MDVINDISDPLKQGALSYGKHAVQGDLTKHVVDVSGASKKVTIQQMLGIASQLFFDNDGNPFWVGGGWDAMERLYYGPQGAGVEITADNYRFHSGGLGDVPDDLFPDDIPHPKASYYGAQLPDGLVDDNDPGNMFGIFRTLKLANYNEDGEQVDEDDDPIPGGSDPNDYLWYAASPQREIADLYRRSRRNLVNINWPAWCYLRDWNATLIPWDDGALTPHQIKVDPAGGGAIAAGTKIWVRVATLKAGDISSASQDVADDGYTEAAAVVGAGGAVTATWASQIDRGADGYRVYVGTAKGAEDRYFTVGSGATNTLTITTLAGATMGPPPEICTGALLRSVPRFESHIFTRPPFKLSTIVDRIAQITCMDWNYSGGKLVLVSPELQEPIVTLDRSLLTNFKTYPVDQRENWNQIVGIYRDLDDPNLAPAAKPVVVNRFELQRRNGLISKQIDFGCAYRSQVERGCHYWARRLIDSNQYVEKLAAPRIYRLLPANAIAVTHSVPGWEAVPFYIETKEENEDVRAGYPITAQLYGEWYSDTNHSPMPRPLPQTNPSVFVAPPVIDDVTLSVQLVEQATGDAYLVIRAEVQFAAYAGEQRGRVWIKKPGGAYERTQIVFPPEPGTLQGSFEWPVVSLGDYKIKVVTESRLGVTADFVDHPEFAITVTDALLKGPEPTDLGDLFYEDTNALLTDWTGQTGKGGSKREIYDLQFSVPGDGDFSTVREVTIDRAVQQMASSIPWEFDSDDDADTEGPGAGSGFALVAPGGFDGTIHPGDPHWLVVRSRVKAIVFEEIIFQYEIAPDSLMPTRIGICPDGEDPETSEYGLWWGVGSNYVYGDAQPDGEVISEPAIARTWITADGVQVHPILAGNRPAIVIGRDRVPRFVFNYENGHSVPVLTSARKVKVPGLYRAYARMETVGLASVRNANWLRSVPEFVYGPEAQRDDNSDLLPDVINWRVRQHSFYTNGPPSDWVDRTANR